MARHDIGWRNDLLKAAVVGVGMLLLAGSSRSQTKRGLTMGDSLFCLPRSLPAALVQVGAEIARAERAGNHDIPGYAPRLAGPDDASLEARLSGAMRMSRYWRPRRTLRVRLMNGGPSLHAQVMEAAHEWGRLTGITFVASDDSAAEVRVRVVASRVSWSYLGTDALLVPTTAPTMQLGGVNVRSDPALLRAMALHEFGHVLGFIDEHEPEPARAPDSARIARVLDEESALGGSAIARGYLRYLSTAQRQRAVRDERSVMNLPVPNDFVMSGGRVPWRATLSGSDTVLARGVYGG